jgi:hypothetical protein
LSLCLHHESPTFARFLQLREPSSPVGLSQLRVQVEADVAVVTSGLPGVSQLLGTSSLLRAPAGGRGIGWHMGHRDGIDSIRLGRGCVRPVRTHDLARSRARR